MVKYKKALPPWGKQGRKNPYESVIYVILLASLFSLSSVPNAGIPLEPFSQLSLALNAFAFPVG